ncbi:MAG: metalloregulator ArsR/SmtB family transcription factor [Phycisphaeraceae bacterium]
MSIHMNDGPLEAVNRPMAPDECATILRVLADGTRLGVVRLLMNQPRRVGDLKKSLLIDQSLLSHHLRVMRDAGLVTAERDGKAVLYRLSAHLKAKQMGNGIDLGCCHLVFDQPKAKKGD